VVFFGCLVYPLLGAPAIVWLFFFLANPVYQASLPPPFLRTPIHYTFIFSATGWTSFFFESLFPEVSPPIRGCFKASRGLRVVPAISFILFLPLLQSRLYDLRSFFESPKNLLALAFILPPLPFTQLLPPYSFYISFPCASLLGDRKPSQYQPTPPQPVRVSVRCLPSPSDMPERSYLALEDCLKLSVRAVCTEAS